MPATTSASAPRRTTTCRLRSTVQPSERHVVGPLPGPGVVLVVAGDEHAGVAGGRRAQRLDLVPPGAEAAVDEVAGVGQHVGVQRVDLSGDPRRPPPREERAEVGVGDLHDAQPVQPGAEPVDVHLPLPDGYRAERPVRPPAQDHDRPAEHHERDRPRAERVGHAGRRAAPDARTRRPGSRRTAARRPRARRHRRWPTPRAPGCARSTAQRAARPPARRPRRLRRRAAPVGQPGVSTSRHHGTTCRIPDTRNGTSNRRTRHRRRRRGSPAPAGPATRSDMPRVRPG